MNLSYELALNLTMEEVKVIIGFCKILTFASVALDLQLSRRNVTIATLKKSWATPPRKTKPSNNSTVK